MFDLITYAKEQLAMRGLKAQYMEYKALVFPQDSWRMEINAWNGIVFFQHPFDFPIGTRIIGDNNGIVILPFLTNEKAPCRIEEFCGQVVVEMYNAPENQPVVHYLHIYLA